MEATPTVRGSPTLSAYAADEEPALAVKVADQACPKAEGQERMIGTPGFVGERLTEARQARGLTGTSLAEILSVRPGSISQYEHGSCCFQDKNALLHLFFFCS